MKVLACIVLALVAMASAAEPEKRAIVGLGYGAYPYAAAVPYSAYVAPVAAPLPYVAAKYPTPAATVPLAYSGYHYPYVY